MAGILRSNLNQRAAQHTESDKRKPILSHVKAKRYRDSYWPPPCKDFDRAKAADATMKL